MGGVGVLVTASLTSRMAGAGFVGGSDVAALGVGVCKLASGTVGHAKPLSYLSTEPPPDVPLLNVVSYRNDFTVCGPGPHRAAIHEVSAQHPAYSHIRLQAFDETDARLGFSSNKWCCRSAAGGGVPGGVRRSQQGAC